MKDTFKIWNEICFFDYMNRFSLPITKAVKDYSRGMKAKLPIAVALSHDSKILILDEATNGLDPLVRDEITDLFLEFIQEESHIILISSHIVSDLEKICDYIAFIHKGSLIFCEEKDELLYKYGILKCSKQEFAAIDKSLLKGYRENQFGVEALIERSHSLNSSYTIDNATIEDIMLYMGKESQ